MLQDLNSIESICTLGLVNMPGIRELSFVDAADMSVLGNIAPGATYYNIKFRRHTGSFSDKHQRNNGGDYYVKTAEIYVPRFRYKCERIVQELVDRKVIVFVTDNNGDQHRIDYAQFTSEFDTDSNPNGSNGYLWTFTGKDRKKRFFASLSTKELTGEEYTPPAGDEGEFSPAPEPYEPVAEDCCITILVTPIPEPPLASGNILNRNKVVTVSGTGEKYFIDKEGNAILLSSGGMVKEIVSGTGDTFTLSLDFDPDRCIVNRTQNVLRRDELLSDIDTFDIDGNTLYLPAAWPLESGDYIEIYKTA